MSLTAVRVAVVRSCPECATQVVYLPDTELWWHTGTGIAPMECDGSPMPGPVSLGIPAWRGRLAVGSRP